MKNIKNQRGCSLVMRIAGVAVSLAGFFGIFLVKLYFDRLMKTSLLADGVLPIENDNFYLYFDLSLIVCAVLLGLTLLSSVTYVLQGGSHGRFAYFTVAASPVLCAVAMLLLSGFYAYLTHGSGISVTAYLVALGVCEAALFSFPFVLAGVVKSGGGGKPAKKQNK